MKYAAHVYLANFYTAVQIAAKPELSGEALVILRHNRLIECNSLAQTSGVKLHSSRRQAYQTCPNALFLNYIEDDYRQAAETVLTKCLVYTPVIEPVSENEFFLELAGPERPEEVVEELADYLVPAFAARLSVGIAANKFLARAVNMALAAGRLKPTDIAVPPDLLAFYRLEPVEAAAQEFLAPLPLGYLWPLAGAIRQRLAGLGFTTIGQIRELAWELLYREFATQASLIRNLALGRDFAPVAALYPPKQLSREVSFPGGVAELQPVEQRISALAAEIAAALARRGEGCRRLVLQLELEDGSRSETRSFSKPQNSLSTIGEVLKALLNRCPIDSAVLGFKVTAAELRPVGGCQLTLFADQKALAGQEPANRERLNGLLTTLGKRFAPRQFYFGRELQTSRREQMLEFWDPLRFKNR
ncbi:MAG TPA: hypothetical protein VHQ46_03425 [Desulfobacteria bacterium]|nr:hypothetical protein [Desulfobacteria bacterium]